jgi:hypothetical protein
MFVANVEELHTKHVIAGLDAVYKTENKSSSASFSGSASFCEELI